MLPPLVLKAGHLGGSAFCNFYRLGVPEQALGRIPLGFGIVVEDNHVNFVLVIPASKGVNVFNWLHIVKINMKFVIRKSEALSVYLPSFIVFSQIPNMPTIIICLLTDNSSG